MTTAEKKHHEETDDLAGCTAFERAMILATNRATAATERQTAATERLVDEQRKTNEIATIATRLEDTHDRQLGEKLRLEREAFDAEHAAAATPRQVLVDLPNVESCIPEQCRDPEDDSPITIRTTLFLNPITASMIAAAQPGCAPKGCVQDIRYRKASVGQSRVVELWVGSPGGGMNYAEVMEPRIRAAVRKNIEGQHRDLIDAGQLLQAAELLQKIEGHSLSDSVRGVAWWRMRAIHALQALVVGKVFEDLVARGIVVPVSAG